jgi:hypothetical protein
MSADRLRELFDQHADDKTYGYGTELCMTWEAFEAAARALLAEAQPTQAEILKCCWLDDEPELCPSRCVFDDPSERISDCTYARCLQAEGKDKTACKYYRAAVETQPEPVEPTDQELLGWMLKAATSVPGGQCTGILDWDKEAIAAARAVLAQWGRPAPEPVSVAERLPTQELNELDDQGTCWMFHQLNFHYCLCRPDPSVHTHWLPHWALPLPQEQADYTHNN